MRDRDNHIYGIYPPDAGWADLEILPNEDNHPHSLRSLPHVELSFPVTSHPPPKQTKPYLFSSPSHFSLVRRRQDLGRRWWLDISGEGDACSLDISGEGDVGAIGAGRVSRWRTSWEAQIVELKKSTGWIHKRKYHSELRCQEEKGWTIVTVILGHTIYTSHM